jgi:hypothetical protein
MVIGKVSTNLALTKLTSWNQYTLKDQSIKQEQKQFAHNLTMDLSSVDSALSLVTEWVAKH